MRESADRSAATAQAVVMRGITKRFPGVVALEDVGLEVCRGELHAICGENGAGKSTLMKILSGVYPPDEGGLEIGGQPVIFASTKDAEQAGIAIIHQELALVEDPVLDVGGARQVVVVVRSAAKRNLVDRVLADPRATCLVAKDDAALARLAAGFTPAEADPYGRPFKGFDDVILAAGSGDTLATAHDLIAPTGGRVLAFAGTRGPCRIESGVWHYGNAAVMGTSGCNTKMMELAIGLLARGRVDVRPLSGRGYTFADLDREGTAAFFEDQLLRPKLLPNEGVPDLPLDSTSPRRTT